MKLAPFGALVTGIIVVVGIALVIPAFTQRGESRQYILLSFSLASGPGASEWCKSLSDVLVNQEVKAVVFASGKAADAHPECISRFAENNLVDIGSQTYSYADLASVSDYTASLREVQDGKWAVDAVARVDSKIFSAPNLSTDENIYSLLSRSEIVADFSYHDHYNRYESGQFVKYGLKRIDSPGQPSKEFFSGLLAEAAGTPVMINFDGSTPVTEIRQFISGLKSSVGDRQDVSIANPSDLFGLDLTAAKEGSP